MSDGGYTVPDYRPAGIVHRGEYIVPAPFDYPKWLKFVWPTRLRNWIKPKVRKYNPDKDVFLKMTGKRIFDE